MAGNQVGHCRAGTLVGHMQKLCVGGLLEQLQRNMGRRSHTGRGKGDASRIGSGLCQQFAQRIEFRARRGDDCIGAPGRDHQGRQVGHRVEARRLIQRRSDGNIARGDQQGMAVRRCPGSLFSANMTRQSGAVFHHHRLPQARVQFFSHQPGDAVHASAGSEGHNEFQRPAGKVGCK